MELMKAKLETMIGFSCCDVERGQKRRREKSVLICWWREVGRWGLGVGCLGWARADRRAAERVD